LPRASPWPALLISTPRNLNARLHLGDLLISSTQYAEARQQGRSRASAGRQKIRALTGCWARSRFIRCNTSLRKTNSTKLLPLTLTILRLSRFGSRPSCSMRIRCGGEKFPDCSRYQPDDPQTYINLASFYKGQMPPGRAEQVLQQGIAKDPRAG